MNFRSYILDFVLVIPAILIGFTFHELAHAIVADRLGDKTPRFQGRLTLNPFAHIDPIGFIMILLTRFGWAKPVQVNSRAFKNYYKDDLKVSLAGPVANLIVAFFAAILYGLYLRTPDHIYFTSVGMIVDIMLKLIVIINVNLFLFNLLPLPGLDGFHILEDLFPKFFYKYGEAMYRYQFLILILMVGTNITFFLLNKPSGFITKLLLNITAMIAS